MLPRFSVRSRPKGVRLVAQVMFAFMAIASPVSAQSTTAGRFPDRASERQIAPSILFELAGKNWIAYDRKAFQYLEYSWDSFGQRLVYSGLDNDGNVVAGDYTLDSITGRTYSFGVRRGIVSEFIVNDSGNQLELIGEEVGVPIAQVVRRERNGLFKIFFLELRKSRWVKVREAKLFQATPQQIRALGWVENNPEFEAQAENERRIAMASNPSFGKRLLDAFSEGLVAGVRQGVESKVARTIDKE
jgi:hypothetical protein